MVVNNSNSFTNSISAASLSFSSEDGSNKRMYAWIRSPIIVFFIRGFSGSTSHNIRNRNLTFMTLRLAVTLLSYWMHSMLHGILLVA